MLSIASTFHAVNTEVEHHGAIGSLITAMPTPAARTPQLSSAVTSLAAATSTEQAAKGAWINVGQRLQHEAGKAEFAQQHLAAQLQSAEHIAAIKGAAHGSGLRVQIVGSQPAQW